MLGGFRSAENGAASYTYMQYGLSPPRRIESRRNREMVKKQVHAMANGEECSRLLLAHFLVDSRCKSMGTGEQRRAYCVRSRMRSVEAAGKESCRRRQSATIRARGALENRRWSTAHNACIRELLQEVNVHGKADRHMRLFTIETENRMGTLWDQEECNQFARRKSCGQQ
jgi:hypothetical protein